ncbi:MAG: EAL domain-containing protein [Symploca sp. SIO2B6]|nr:EAL domain-containing protein [Symploca sp. SIO2B6]
MILISLLTCLIPCLFTFVISRFFLKKNRCVKQVTAIKSQLKSPENVRISSKLLHQKTDINSILIETSAAFFVVIDSDGKTLMMNRCFLRVLGYTVDQVLGTDYLSTFIPENERESLAKIFIEARNFVPLQQLNQPIEQETGVLTNNGRKILVEWRIQPKFRTNGQLECFCCTGIDVTEHRQSQEQLHHSQEKYCSIVQEQTEPICRFVADGTLTFVNDAYCCYFSKTQEELIGHSFFPMIPAQYRDKIHSHLAKLSLSQPVTTREYQVLMPNGEIRWQQWTDQVITNKQGDTIVEFQSIGRDITERRLVEQESSRLASFALLDPNPIVEINLAGQVLYLNPQAMQLWPNLRQRGVHHPFLAGIPSMAKALQREGSLRREVKIDQVYYEQVLHYVEEISCFRIYAFNITERKQAEAQLIYNAFYDQLTGLANRALFMDRLRRAFRVAKQHRRINSLDRPYLLALLFLDLNRFQLVNDSLGNQVGDQLLRFFAHRIETCLRPTDTLARLGGDEFAIILEGIEDITQATRIADAIDNTLSLPFCLDKSEVFMSVSIGIALSTVLPVAPKISQGKQLEEEGGSSLVLQPEDLLRNASIAMYRAKAEAQSCYVIFDSTMYSHAVDRLQLETDLRRAIERQEFMVYYQPIVSLATGQIIGFEALLRWQHPQRGLVYPTEFIPTAEETGLISPMDWWTLRQACHQMKLWQEEFQDIQPLTINVNLSCQQFTQPDLIQQIDAILQETELSANSLKLEITESQVMDNPDLVRNWLLQLKQRQINLCIDDFGTGYSSLSRLDNFPINTLKIDRSFVSRIGAPGKNAEIIQAIVNLAQTLNIEVVAEGIEASEQADSLLALQCEYGQGYLFSKPVDSHAARKLLMDGVNQLEINN